ncbi:MAG: hypothetical protein NZL85_10535, partial [Fimbriimonadales bacterium]|nr:hypothetical protein [Fimbriimonadales bacterium]
MGYVVNEVGCIRCGAGCNPVWTRCPRCGNDPLQGAGYLVGPLSMGQFHRIVGIRLLIVAVLGAAVLVKEGVASSSDAGWLSALGWTGALLVALVLSGFIRTAWQLWRLTRMRLVIHSAGITLFYRGNGRTYLDWMGWGELAPPSLEQRHWLLKLFNAVGHLMAIGGFHWLALLIPEPLREMRLRSLTNPARCWSIPLSPALQLPIYTLTLLAVHALPQWLASGQVRQEPGDEPTPKRPFLALDLSQRILRAYAFREVLLDDAPSQIPMQLLDTPLYEAPRPESINPDGARVVPDHTLDPEKASGGDGNSVSLPAFALPYEGRYWLRAD